MELSIAGLILIILGYFVFKRVVKPLVDALEIYANAVKKHAQQTLKDVETEE